MDLSVSDPGGRVVAWEAALCGRAYAEARTRQSSIAVAIRGRLTFGLRTSDLVNATEACRSTQVVADLG